MTSVAEKGRCPACAGSRTELARRAPWPDVDLWRCQPCGTEYLDPQPTDARLAEIYGPAYYEAWHLESPEVLRRMKQLTMGPILDAAKLEPGQSLLDVGCATGDLAALAVERDLKVFGLDLNAAAIERASGSVPDARFAVGTLADEPFEGESFDAVTMVDFIEHVRDPAFELAHVANRLAPGGKLIISTPRVDSPVRVVVRTAWPQYREEHLTYFSLTGMHAALQQAGFTIDAVAPTRKALTPAYLYGQTQAYPLPVVSALARRIWPVAPIPKHRPLRLRMGEMTVVATRRTDR